MTHFPIDCDVKSFKFSYGERNNPVWSLELYDEWTLVYASVNNPNVTTTDYFIKIHRENTDREFTVAGELTITNGGCLAWRKKFSQFIETGSSFLEIDRVPSINMISGVERFHGHLNIIGNSKKSMERLSNDFERLLDPTATCFADVTLKCDGTSIPAHKIILFARSPVFEAMFTNPMKESLQNEVDVTDIDVNTLRALLAYMYTGKTSNLSASLAADLLFAADKYQLQDLKNVCIDVLKASVSLQNVLKILILGDLHSEDLKCFAVDYICNKCVDFSVIEKTEEWNNLRKERPGLTIDVLTSLVKSRDKKLKN